MIVIARKNNIAVQVLNYLTSCQEINNLVMVCNKSDKETYTWQMPLRRKIIHLRVMEIINKCAV